MHTLSSQSVVSLYSYDCREVEASSERDRWTPQRFSHNLLWPSHPPSDSGVHLKNSCWATLHRKQGSWLCLGNRRAEPSSAGQLNPMWSSSIAGGIYWQPNALRNNALVNPCLGTSGQFNGISFSLQVTHIVMKSMGMLLKPQAPAKGNLTDSGWRCQAVYSPRRLKDFKIDMIFFFLSKIVKDLKVFLLWWCWRDSKSRNFQTEQTLVVLLGEYSQHFPSSFLFWHKFLMYKRHIK